MIALLKEFGRGQITLPKKWRDRYGTNVYVAKETSQGLLIVPFTDDAIKVDEKLLKSESKPAAKGAERVERANPFKKKVIAKK